MGFSLYIRLLTLSLGGMISYTSLLGLMGNGHGLSAKYLELNSPKFPNPNNSSKIKKLCIYSITKQPQTSSSMT